MFAISIKRLTRYATKILFIPEFSGVEIPRAIHQIANILAGKMAGNAITKAPPEHEDVGGGSFQHGKLSVSISTKSSKFAMSAGEMG